MYGFLDSSLKRKAFRKALDNAFDAGYDPSVVVAEKDTLKKLGTNIQPINFETQKVEPIINKPARSLRKPETSVVDLSKHKNWRNDKLKDDKPIKSSGASLYDELFGNNNKVEPPANAKSYSNLMFDELLPDSNEKSDEDFSLIAEKSVDAQKVEGVEEKAVSNAEDDENFSWEELFGKLQDDDDDAGEKVEVPEIPQVEINIIDDDKIEEKVAEPKPAKKAASKTKNTGTQAKVAARNKKRKNKIKFDADIIGGW